MLIGVVTPSTWEPLAILKWERMERAQSICSTLEPKNLGKAHPIYCIGAGSGPKSVSACFNSVAQFLGIFASAVVTVPGIP
jgi:hypothetical protein